MFTQPLYLEDFTITEHEAKVVRIESEVERIVVILDSTHFYPQGGGQPYDQGEITSPTAQFIVEDFRFVDGEVRHIGHFESRSFSEGETVVCRINKERRQLMSRLHSAGHVVDLAMKNLGITWVPGKGFHFSEGSYVEYIGSFEGMDKEKLQSDLEAECNKAIQADLTTKLEFMDKAAMEKVCAFVPDKLPEGKPSRVVFFGEYAIPCGGTHVKSLGEIGSMSIRKVKNSGEGVVRVSYEIAQA